MRSAPHLPSPSSPLARVPHAAGAAVVALSFGALSLGGAALGCGGRHEAIVVSPQPPPDLGARAEIEARAAGEGSSRVGEALFGVAHREDGFTDWRLQLDAGTCYWFGYAGDAGVERFSMYIFSPKDRRLDSARGRPQHGVFTHCAKESGIYRLQGKVSDGAGHFAVVVYKAGAKEAPAPAPAAATPPSANLEELIEKQAAAAAPGAKRAGELFSGSAETSEYYTALEAGKCFWIIAAGEPGKVKRLYVYLWDPRNKRVTESKSESEQVMVGHCAATPGMYKFQLRVDSGSGQYKAGVYVK